MLSTQPLVYPTQAERWSPMELCLQGPSQGNPFMEQSVTAVFRCSNEEVTVSGFYDGDGVYRVRFMPSFQGTYSFTVTSTFSQPLEGTFQVTPATGQNHGMVRVANTWHLAYEDGTPYYSVGTTCYVWPWQDDAIIAQTLETLKNSAFNKIRFCVFPKHYDYNLREPRSYPYEGTPMDASVLTSENFHQYTGKTEGNHWDFFRFHPAHFRHLDRCMETLLRLGIQADLILFHPYDRWGFSSMTRAQDLFYVRYMAARYSAYRNVWWSLANEYDLMPAKELADWEAIADTICQSDPYRHLRSIHSCAHFYDYSRPWVTHCSIQRQDLYKSAELVETWRESYRKPVILDEICYEGDIQHGWGNISGQELVRRFWEAAVRGGYAGHGETFLHHEGILWWSHGGKLYGESPSRFRFLYEVLRQTPGIGLRPYRASWDEVCAVPQEAAYQGTYYLHYYSFMRPSFRDFALDENSRYEVHVLDTWEMTDTCAGIFSGTFRIALPAKPYMAIQIKRLSAPGA